VSAVGYPGNVDLAQGLAGRSGQPAGGGQDARLCLGRAQFQGIRHHPAHRTDWRGQFGRPAARCLRARGGGQFVRHGERQRHGFGVLLRDLDARTRASSSRPGSRPMPATCPAPRSPTSTAPRANAPPPTRPARPPSRTPGRLPATARSKPRGARPRSPC
jgi:hypothetical protein